MIRHPAAAPGRPASAYADAIPSAPAHAMPSSRRTGRRLLRGTVVGLATVLLAGCSQAAGTASTTTSSPATSTPSTTAGPSPTTPVPSAVERVYTAMLVSISKQSSVHYVASSTATSSGTTSKLHFVANTGTSAGVQVCTWSGGNKSGTFTIIAIGAVTYFKGDVNSLATFFQAVPVVQASKYAGKWISFVPTDKLYSSLRNDITMASVAKSIEFRPATARTRAGTIVLAGASIPTSATPAGEKATARTILARATTLPISQSFDASYKGSTDQSSITFSEWGLVKLPTAPAGSITWTSVQTAIAAASG